MEKLQASGKVRAIGVSNFTIAHLKELLEDSETHVTPAVNQVEFHPLLYSVQRPLLEFCRENGIVLQAYAPLASAHGASQLLNHPILTAIAMRHGVTGAEVALRWALNHGVSVIPKSSDPERIRANAAPSLLSGKCQQQVRSDKKTLDDTIATLDVSVECDWALSTEEMEALNAMSGSDGDNGGNMAKRFCWNPNEIL